jgi:hypothetical protein
MKGWNERLETFDLSREMFAVMHSGSIMNQTCMILGMNGSGKSYVAMSLGYSLACLESQRVYGKGNISHWREFFDVDHIGIIDPASVKNVMGNIKPYNIYILDDVGGANAYSARKWQSAQNSYMNSVFTTFRTQRAYLLVSVQSSSMIDVIARNLFNWQIEAGVCKVFKYGVSFVKVFKTVLKPRLPASRRVFYYYPRGRNAVYDICACLAPPKSLSDAYDKIREKEAQNLANKKGDIADGNGDENGTPRKQKSITQLLREYEDKTPRPSSTNRKARAAWNKEASRALNCSLRYVQSFK